MAIVKVGPIEGVEGNWFFDVSSNSDNQFLVPTRMNNILPSGVTVTAGGPVVVPQVASQDEDSRNAVREMVENLLDEATSSSNYHHIVSKDSGKIVHSGSKKEMLKRMRELNNKHGGGSHYLGYSHHKKVGDLFRSTETS